MSLQLLPFGKSDDDLGELTFEVGLFSVLPVWRGRSVHEGPADSPRGASSSSVLRVLVSFRFDPVLF
jgi:hypothetical protein